MMETAIEVKRKWFTEKSTIGELYFDGAFQCFTLEDKVREIKVPNETAIPEGKYQVIISFSNRFQKFMPLIVDVPGFEGIRIHSGNRPEDTEGCILVGETKESDAIGNSRSAFNSLMPRLEKATKSGKVWIEIKNCPPEKLAV